MLRVFFCRRPLSSRFVELVAAATPCVRHRADRFGTNGSINSSSSRMIGSSTSARTTSTTGGRTISLQQGGRRCREQQQQVQVQQVQVPQLRKLHATATTRNNRHGKLYCHSGDRHFSSLSQRWTTATTTSIAHRDFSTRTTAAAADMVEATTTTKKKKRRQLYMWGTDNNNGCVRKPPKHAGAKLLDRPYAVDVDVVDVSSSSSSFGGDDDNDLELESVICGATDTAWIFRDTTSGPSENSSSSTSRRCWVAGENKQGQLGVGNKNAVSTSPVELKLPVYDNDHQKPRCVKSVALGPNFGAVVDDAGDLYTAGFGGSALSGGMGALGHGDSELSVMRWKLVESLIEDGVYVDQVCCGESHLTVLTTEGEVLTSGAGSYGRLGNFDTVDQLYLEPVEILGDTTSGGRVISIAGGKSFTLALTAEGVIYGWGRNHKGQLGMGFGLAVDMYSMSTVPEPIESDELIGRRVAQVTAGQSHAACVTESGEVFFWGMALHLEPVKMHSLAHTRIVRVAAGRDYTLALDENGNLYSFGTSTKTGAMGLGAAVKGLPNQAQKIRIFDEDNNDNDNINEETRKGGRGKVVQVSAGWKHAACIVETL